MRLLHVSLDGNLPRYGIGLAVVRLCEALAALGHDVTLACRVANAVGLEVAGVRVLGLERRRSLLSRRRGYLRQLAPALEHGDVVHVHGLARMASWLVAPRARRGRPLVVTAHASDELGPAASPSGDAPPARARRHRAQVGAVLAGADLVVAPSRWMAGRARDAGARAVRTIGLGPTDAVPVVAREHAGFRVLALARLVPVKGVDLLVEAFAAAFARGASGADATLTIAGDGPLRETLVARALSLGVAERVALPGYVDAEARRALLAAADVVVVPTRGDYETFGLAALDASAAGVPVVAAGGGALPERVEHGEGVVVPAGDAVALAAALVRLHDDPSERRRMGERGRATAARASWRSVGIEHAHVYEGLAGPRL